MMEIFLHDYFKSDLDGHYQTPLLSTIESIEKIPQIILLDLERKYF